MYIKKILFFTTLVGFLISAHCYADTQKIQPSSVIVNIQNLGVENCVLISKDMSQGKVRDYSSVPGLLITGESEKFIVESSALRVVEFTLNYKCGEHKTFSLYMKNFHKKGYRHRSTDVTFEGIDVFESHKLTPGWERILTYTEPGPAVVGEPTQISWVITH